MFRSLMTKSAVALVAVGASTLTAVSAQAASGLFPSPGTCTINKVDHASACAGVYTGSQASNPSTQEVLEALNDENLFGDINDWKFDSKTEDLNGDAPGIDQGLADGLNFLGLSLTGPGGLGNGIGQTSGTFSFSNINPAITNIVVALKGGTNYALYFIPKNTYAADKVFNWSTADFSVGNGRTPELSNFSVYYQVPTPALIPGLIGLGVAALRKKQEQEGDAAD